MNGDGRDDLAVVTSASLGLRTYDFTTKTFSAVAGGSIQDLTSGNVDADARDEIMVTNSVNAIYLFESGGFTGVSGGGSALAAGEFDGDANREFLITGGSTPGSGSGLYFYRGETGSFAAFQTGGSSINRIAAGNLVPGDSNHEVYLTNTLGDPYVSDAAGYVSTTGSGSDIGVGRLDADLGTQELAYIIGGGDSIYQGKLNWGTGSFGSGYVFLPVDPTSDPTAVGGNSGFTDFIVADIDGDNLDELIARRGGDTLYRFDNGATAFTTAAFGVPEPSSLALAALGLGLTLLLRRRV